MVTPWSDGRRLPICENYLSSFTTTLPGSCDGRRRRFVTVVIATSSASHFNWREAMAFMKEPWSA